MLLRINGRISLQHHSVYTMRSVMLFTQSEREYASISHRQLTISYQASRSCVIQLTVKPDNWHFLNQVLRGFRCSGNRIEAGKSRKTRTQREVGKDADDA